MSILDASLSWNGRLATPAKEAVQYFYKQMDKKDLIDKCISSGNWTDADRTKLIGIVK